MAIEEVGGVVVDKLLNEFLGLGPLQPLIDDVGISDIMVNGHKEVYVERSGKLQKTAVQFRSEEQLLNLARRIVSKVGRRIDESTRLWTPDSKMVVVSIS